MKEIAVLAVVHDEHDELLTVGDDGRARCEWLGCYGNARAPQTLTYSPVLPASGAGANMVPQSRGEACGDRH